MPEITTPQTTETAPAPAQTTPRPPVKPNGGRKKKKMEKIKKQYYQMMKY